MLDEKECLPGFLDPAVRALREIESETDIWESEEGPQALFVLLEGTAFSFTYLIGGRRHIDDIFGFGAICNLDRIGNPQAKVNLHFKRGSRVAIVDPGAFEAIRAENATLRAAIDQCRERRARRRKQRVRTLISLPGPLRMINLLLDLVEENRIADPEREWVPLTLTQEEIADLLGLTEVHVNRVLARMQKAGEIERTRSGFRLGDARQLRRQLAYVRTSPLAATVDDPWPL